MDMRDERMSPPEEVMNAKPRKRKPLNRVATAVPVKEGGTFPSQQSSKKVKGTKRNLKNEISVPFEDAERSTPDSLPDASGSSEEYRALRRKYLLLEDESFSFDREISSVAAEVKALEDEKFALLDQLVVLEGLVDPSEIQQTKLL